MKLTGKTSVNRNMEMIRAFIAIELDDPVLRALEKVQAELKRNLPSSVVRWVNRSGIHLTLKFLGDTPSSQIADIEAALRLACAAFAPFRLTCAGLGCFPNPSRPRVVWVGVKEPSGALIRLQEAIEREVAPLGYPPEVRAFSPHLTLGRAQRNASGSDLRVTGERIVSYQAGKLAEMEVSSVGLIRSDLRAAGAVYTPLARVPLG